MGIINKVLAAVDPGVSVNPNKTLNFDKLKMNIYDGGTTWQKLVEKISGYIFILAGVIAFFYLIYSGFIYLTASGNPDAAKKGQQGIINAIIGLVIIFLAYAIVRAVISFLA